MSEIYSRVEQALFAQADEQKRTDLMRFFKTGPGEYAEGDLFIGVTVPKIRKTVKQFKSIGLDDIEDLLGSSYHEVRLMGLLILVERMKKADPQAQRQIFDLYLSNTGAINNWDLVDVSAPHIVGRFLENDPLPQLEKLALSSNLWERRIAIIATFYHIRQNRFQPTLHIALLLLEDQHDLIHKAVGWMLREIGNRNLNIETSFLNQHYPNMPRTMLRYAIEKFPEPLRQDYLKGRI
jgi:3-methyladenine DNA glycosylase AlkD